MSFRGDAVSLYPVPGIGLGLLLPAAYVTPPALSVSPLAIWDARAGVSLSGTNVQSVADQSGNGWNLGLGTSPVWSSTSAGGLPGITHTAASAQYLITPSMTSLSGLTAFTAFLICEITLRPTTSVVLDGAPTVAPGTWDLYNTSGELLSGEVIQSSTTFTNDGVSPGAAVASMCCYAATWQANLGNVQRCFQYINGGSQLSNTHSSGGAPSSTTFSSTTVSIGGRTGGLYPSTLTWGQVSLYAGAASALDIAAMNTYAATWGAP
jgi:hypothetical protein